EGRVEGCQTDFGAAAEMAEHLRDVPRGRSRRTGQIFVGQCVHQVGDAIVAATQGGDDPVGAFSHPWFLRVQNECDELWTVTSAEAIPLCQSVAARGAAGSVRFGPGALSG